MNTYYVAGIPYTSELYHHGIKGQKWGIRRFQNYDGTLTPDGKARYSDGAKSFSDLKLKRTVLNNTAYGKSQNSLRVYREATRRLKSGESVWSLGNQYVRRMAEARLKDIGFDNPTREDVDRLMGQDWWRVPYDIYTDIGRGKKSRSVSWDV